MADVTRVGKGGPSPDKPSGPKRKKKGDTEAFKEMMKVGKVRETDPEEKRNRKRQAEAEEEMKGELAAQVPQQGLPDPQAPPPGFQPPSTGGAVEGTQGPTPAGGAAPSAPEEEEPGVGGSPPSYQPSQQQQQQPTAAQTQPSRPANQKEQPPKGSEPRKTPGTVPAKKEAKEGYVPFQPEKTPTKKEEKKEVAKFKEDVEEPPLPPGAWEAIKQPSKKEETESVTPQTVAPLPTAIPASPTAPPPPLEPIASPFAHLPPQVAQIFDRMVGVMTVMNETGIKETTITLTNPQFAKSQFFGAQIIITEFSTAPREYNIQLLGNQQAVTAFQNNQEELVAAFQAGNYNFKVNRLEIGYLTAPESVKRKETRRVTRKKKGEM